MQDKKGYMHGAILLLISGCIVKILGALFKIPLTNLIGDRGMGMFSFAMQFFSILFVICAAGIPVAESYLVSESLARGRSNQARRMVCRITMVFTLFSMVLASGLAIGSDSISVLFGEPEAGACLTAIAPAVVLVTMEAGLRGWYQGTGNMEPTSVSQVLEAVGKLLFGLLFARRALEFGLGISGAAAGAVLGVTIGELIAVLYLVWSVRHSIIATLFHREPWIPKTFSRFFSYLFPVTLGAAVMTVSGFLDMALLYRRLPLTGLSTAEVTAQYGAYTGMAMTLFNLPQALSNSVSISVLPALSAAHACRNTKQERRLVTSSMRLTLLVCLPCGAGLFVFAEPLLRVLFASQPRGIQTAEPLLRLLGIAEPLVGLSAVATAVLQSFGRPDLTVYAMAAACTTKFAVGFYLAGQPEINILAAPIGTLVCYSVMLLMNLISIVRQMHWIPPLLRAILRPLAASVGMAVLSLLLEQYLVRQLPLLPAVLLSVLAAVPIYVVLLLVFHALEAEDVRPFPGGEQLIRFLHLKE